MGASKPCVPAATPRQKRWPWRRVAPWEGRATRMDLALMGAIMAAVAVTFALRPLKPFLLAEHPAALAFLTGDIAVIGVAAAFAGLGELPLWLAVAAGAGGMVKFDWLMWWASKQWGAGIIAMFTTSERALRLAGRAGELSPWIVRASVVLAVFPGVPTAVVYAAAGFAGMRLSTFLLLDLAGALLMTSLVAGLGYRLGDDAVDVVLLIDRHASLVGLTTIAVAITISALKRRRTERGVVRRGRGRATQAPWADAACPRHDESAHPRRPAH